MKIEKFVRATCLICGYTRFFEDEKEVPKVCPACQDGKEKSWVQYEKA